MKFLSLRRNGAAAAVLVSLFAVSLSLRVHAQATESKPVDVPAAPQASPAGDPEFPKPDPADFTADSPTKEQVLAFLQASWGYDSKRIYQVQRILKTSVPNLASVIVLVGEKGNKQSGALQFFVLPDGQHLIAQGELLPFGPHPFAENRAILQKRADGPFRGSESKSLELVEFADFQCPHCKDAQATMDKLAADFPNAHIAYESFPLTHIHPQAKHAAAYGVCVAKLGGNKAFFDYAAAVYDGQAGLASEEGATLTLNSAVTKAGLSPDKVAECAKSPETDAAVEATIKLANDLGVDQTPELFINGRKIGIGGIPYDSLKELVNWHIQNDSK